MNLRSLHNRVISSIVGLASLGSLVALSAHPASAQTVIATVPFPFCTNNQPYPSGTYKFTIVSEWLLSIRDLHGGDEKLFPIHPESYGSPTAPKVPTGNVGFSTIQGLRELETVRQAGSNMVFEMIGRGTEADKSTARGRLHATNCFTQQASLYDHGR